MMGYQMWETSLVQRETTSKAGSKASNSSTIKSDRDVDVFTAVWTSNWAITAFDLASCPVPCSLS